MGTSRNKKHGHYAGGKPSPTYTVWHSMVERCTKQNKDSYKYYGAKGVKVCDEWLVFQNFLNDMGERPEGLTIDRINNSDGYHKDNCRWATMAEQRRNSSRVQNYTLHGKTQCLKDWANELSINYITLLCRIIRSGMSFEQAIAYVKPSKL